MRAENDELHAVKMLQLMFLVSRFVRALSVQTWVVAMRVGALLLVLLQQNNSFCAKLTGSY